MTADQPEAVVLIDGERRGTAGQPITDVCHGDHTVDVRSPMGQFSQHVRVEFDREIRMQARLVPTYGVVNTLSRDGGAGVLVDRAAVIQALRTDGFKFVPVELLEAEVALLASATGEDLQRATDRLTQRLDTQGVATLARVAPDAASQDVELRLFAKGASKPDVLRFSLTNEASLKRAVASLDHQVRVVQPTIGIEVVDVMRLDGALVTKVDPDGPSARVIMPGDVIVGIGVASIANVTDLLGVLETIADATATRAAARQACIRHYCYRAPSKCRELVRQSTLQCHDH